MPKIYIVSKEAYYKVLGEDTYKDYVPTQVIVDFPSDKLPFIKSLTTYPYFVTEDSIPLAYLPSDCYDVDRYFVPRKFADRNIAPRYEISLDNWKITPINDPDPYILNEYYKSDFCYNEKYSIKESGYLVEDIVNGWSEKVFVHEDKEYFGSYYICYPYKTVCRRDSTLFAEREELFKFVMVNLLGSEKSKD